MKVTIFHCGPAANESELKAFAHLKSRLESAKGTAEWVLLTNLAFSVTHQMQSDEIDLISIGPTGVRVIEIKHWTAQWCETYPDLVEHEAEKLANKARKVGTTLRKIYPALPRVPGNFLLTQETSKAKRLTEKLVRGAYFLTLAGWKEALDIDGAQVLENSAIAKLSRALEPRSVTALDGRLPRLAGYANLLLQTPKNDRFHRVYKARHPSRQDAVILHLYDLTAEDDKNALARANREFATLQRLQLYSWAPRILDSFQEVPGYFGEMWFFTLLDPCAPCLFERAKDQAWDLTSRLAFSRKSFAALKQLHSVGDEGNPILHRKITPHAILVRHDNTPIFTGFDLARLPADVTIASATPLADNTFQAPEIVAQGLSAAGAESDVFALCATVENLFDSQTTAGQDARRALRRGMSVRAQERVGLADIEAEFARLLGDVIPPTSAPAARFWSEDQLVQFRDRTYCIVSRLGSGGVGITFKVIEIDKRNQEELGVYVAKAAYDGNVGENVLKGYRLARSHLGRHRNLSAIFEVANEWQENNFLALMTWIEGAPLSEFIGVFPLLAEEQQEVGPESMALRWITDMCEALAVLHKNGLVHGDVSPKNMIVSGTEIVLTDYDFVRKVGAPADTPGTLMYAAPTAGNVRTASPSDDVFALAASFFHVIFEKEPFCDEGATGKGKERVLNWPDGIRNAFPKLSEFLSIATHVDPAKRFAYAENALNWLKNTSITIQPGLSIAGPALSGTTDTPEASDPVGPAGVIHTGPHEVPWLKYLLQSYAGALYGGGETRGLDSDFATATYVTTEIEEELLRDIRERRARLVVLCGNAGDGKTALLQHLAQSVGMERHTSEQRIFEGLTDDGLLVRMNLDGSAAWRGRSADELMTEFLHPFHDGPPSEDIVHLLAVNDGRLHEWIERIEGRNRSRTGMTKLTEALGILLEDGDAPPDSFIRFMNLNRRSLVGGLTPDAGGIETEFLHRLVDQLYGGKDAGRHWEPCASCSIKERCHVFYAGRLFGPPHMPEPADDAIRLRARKRLFEALQAVHLRGEKHITMRELRSSLVYILFGVHYCLDRHEPGDFPIPPQPYWDRAFAPDSQRRQGEVLSELSRFDPALEAHPQIDRRLMRRSASEDTFEGGAFGPITLASERRRAYFEWSETDLERIAGDSLALELARGRHLRLFRDLPVSLPVDVECLCAQVCAGISRLEDLPPQALERSEAVSLRITPRTPTDTSFWVEKPLSAFRLEPILPRAQPGMERLHRQARLTYESADGRIETLDLGYELFHVLMELHEGYQLGDVSTDDTFANLSIFVQRLVREDETQLMTWNPMDEEAIYRIAVAKEQTVDGPKQRMTLRRII